MPGLPGRKAKYGSRGSEGCAARADSFRQNSMGLRPR